MLEQNTGHISAPPPKLLPLLEKLKTVYKLWFGYYTDVPKTHRYTLGVRIDDLFIDCIESIAVASFTSRPDKLPHVRLAMRKLDTLKILLLVLWEAKSLDDKKYIALSLQIESIGKMLGGWHGQLAKQNSPGNVPREA